MNNRTYPISKLKTLFIVLTLIILVPDLPAYDGDVDYSAPYITVDPETGKLVTIDPKAQPQPQHTVTDPNSSQTASAVNQTDNNEQSAVS
ncbi:MAG: hypothetical protein GTO60_08430 [Gammaproteobacteria bacterium]|nr:hypothetical protein [Gammaproteobacteria bacterium]NIO62462.1 hypothetical protein [Gammaproteobacteria bacterium]